MGATCCKSGADAQVEPTASATTTSSPKLRLKQMATGSFATIDAIPGIELFDEFSPEQAKKVKDMFHRVVYSKGETIAKQEAVFSGKYGIFILISGQVQISASDGSGSIVPLKTVSMGQWFSVGLGPDGVFMPVTITAITDVILLGLPIEDSKKYQDMTPELSLTIRAGKMSVSLSKIPFFDGIPLMALHQLAALFEYRTYKADRYLYRKGDAADGIYIIVSGTVAMVATRPDGTDILLGLMNHPDYFGELCLSEARPYTNNTDQKNPSEFTLRTVGARTTSPTQLLHLSIDDFQKFLLIAPYIVTSDAFRGALQKRTASSLKGIPFFSGYETKQVGPLQKYDEEGLAMLGELFVYVNVAPDQVIFKQGGPGDAFYLIVSGTVAITSEANEGGSAMRLATLAENDWFGEISLIMDTNRTATATAIAPCVLLKLARDKFQLAMDLSPHLSSQIRQRLQIRTENWLRKLPFFAGIIENKPWSKLGLLGSQFRFREYVAGEVVCKEGQRDDRSFFIIVSGSVRCTILDDGQPRELDVLRDNQWFGEIALLKDTPRTATATCIEDTLFLYLSLECFEKFLVIAPELQQTMTCLIAHRTTNTLKIFPILDNIKENKPWSKLGVLASLMNFKSYPPQTDIITQSDTASCLYFLVSGTCLVLYQDQNGKQHQLEQLTGGQIFGEMALIDVLDPEAAPKLRSATVRTQDDCTILELSSECFKKFLAMSHEILPDIRQLCDLRQQRNDKMLSDIASAAATDLNPDSKMSLIELSPQTVTNLEISKDDIEQQAIQEQVDLVKTSEYPSSP